MLRIGLQAGKAKSYKRLCCSRGRLRHDVALAKADDLGHTVEAGMSPVWFIHSQPTRLPLQVAKNPENT
jgi:hypothetical protein